MPENFQYPPNTEVDAFKIPPNSIQAEQSVLGGLMLDNQTWDSVADKLIEDDFYRKDHRLIFKAITKLADKQDPFDVVTLSEVLGATGELAEVGGLAYLGLLAKDTPSAANIVAYAKIVRDRSILRQLIHVGTDISDSAFYPEGRDTSELLENAERQVFKIAEQRQKGQGGFEPIKSLLATAVDKIETLFEQEGNITGAATGFTDFDNMTSGLQPADLVIVAGRPSMGKTSIAMNMAENIAIAGKKNVAIFSLEMPGDSLAMRMMSSIGRIDQHKVRTGKLKEDEWPRLTSALNILAETKIFIDDTPALTPTEVRSRARRLAREHGELGLIVLDYIQLMQSPSSGENRVQQVGDISRGLKALAKEMNVPVVALSQLNRNLEQRPNKRPVMSDLRESGCLTGDSLVTRADTGERIAIKDLSGKKDFSVWALNEKTLKLEATLVSKVFATGIKPVFRLTTQLGRTICATANHKFYTSQGWKRLDELSMENNLAIPRNISELQAPFKQNVSCERLMRISCVLDSKPLTALAISEIYWDKIINIEPVGEEEVYDLTVPHLHNFVVNDIIAHNSIEQDADLIVFIYRDEVYNEDSPDKGIAEIIIGKQRNGPLGTVRLTFLGQYTKFENYAGNPHADNEDYE